MRAAQSIYPRSNWNGPEDDKIKGGYDRAYSLTNTLAELQAGGNLLIDAGDDLALRGVTVRGGEDDTLQADGDVTIASVQNRTSRDLSLSTAE
ncbi:MAG: hemagglutinin repeat-containing protein [Agrobacterium sp.]|nr:hemagglutinin repeat-containing protein [Agrobacterium sp.]